MTLDEAIKHCEEVARGCEWEARQCDESDGYESHVKAESLNCAADHRQLAEWLTELKEAKRLLKLAVEDMGEENYCAKVCKRDKFACQVSDTCDFKWRYADEALKLIGGSENG